ncbi:MAG TPA: hypothetical protein VIY86_10765, partial [Pirellulaceae bacterium]
WSTVESLLRNFQGREYSGPLTRDTRLFADLAWTSIEAIVLGEELNRRLDQEFPFHELLSGLRDRGAEDLSVGELVDFLNSSASGSD